MQKLQGNGIVTTQMSNLGLEKYLSSLNLQLKRTPVGDRYVSQYMQEHGFNIGGEQSGHIILGDYSTTGDGLIAALQILAVMSEAKEKSSKVFKSFEALPQVLKNIKINKDFNLEDAKIVAIIKQAEDDLGTAGRIFVRKSGTEPLVRIMVEGQKMSEINKIANHIASQIGGKASDNFINNPINVLNNGWKYISNSGLRLWRWGRNSGGHKDHK